MREKGVSRESGTAREEGEMWEADVSPAQWWLM